MSRRLAPVWGQHVLEQQEPQFPGCSHPQLSLPPNLRRSKRFNSPLKYLGLTANQFQVHSTHWCNGEVCVGLPTPWAGSSNAETLCSGPARHDKWQPSPFPPLLGDACPCHPTYQRTCADKVRSSGPRLRRAGSSTPCTWSAGHAAGLGRCSRQQSASRRPGGFRTPLRHL